MDRQTSGLTDTQTDRWADGQKDEWADAWINKWMAWQTGRQKTNRLTGGQI
jgi:hypothetical protein